MYAETKFILPPPSDEVVKLRFHTYSIKTQFHKEPPQLFYDGVVFGLTATNSYNIKVI